MMMTNDMKERQFTMRFEKERVQIQYVHTQTQTSKKCIGLTPTFFVILVHTSNDFFFKDLEKLYLVEADGFKWCEIKLFTSTLKVIILF